MNTEVSGVRLDRDRAQEDAEIRKRRHAGDGAGDIDEAPKVVMVNIMSPLQIDTMDKRLDIYILTCCRLDISGGLYTIMFPLWASFCSGRFQLWIMQVYVPLKYVTFGLRHKN